MVRTTTPEALEVRAEKLRRAIAANTAHMAKKAEAVTSSTERTEALTEAYAAGVTITELAEALGLSPEAVSKALGRPKGPRPRKK